MPQDSRPAGHQPLSTNGTPTLSAEAYIPAGTFRMGDAFDEGYPADGEAPIHEVSTTAIRQARLRWWDGRQETIQGLSSLGGRFTPREAIDVLYSGGNRYSACNTNAVDFFNDPCTGVFDSVRLIVEDKTAATVQSRKYKLENGALTSAAPRYLAEEMPPPAADPGAGSARCAVCGRPLSSPASIARGAGASCAHNV